MDPLQNHLFTITADGKVHLDTSSVAVHGDGEEGLLLSYTSASSYQYYEVHLESYINRVYDVVFI